MSTQKASIGRIVHYQLKADDVEQITRRRTTGNAIAKAIEEGKWSVGAQAHIGNPVGVGRVVALIVTAVWPNEYGEHDGINGQALLDGTDSLWVTSVKEGTEPGEWQWPPRTP